MNFSSLIRVAAVFCLVSSVSIPVHAAPYPTIAQDVGVCDVNAPSHCAAPNSDGSINVKVTGGTGGSSVVTQPTAANLNAQVQGPGVSGAALTGNPNLIGGSDGTNVVNLRTVTTLPTTGVGLLASGLIGQYTNGQATLTTGQYGPVQLNQHSIFMVADRDGTTGGATQSQVVGLPAPGDSGIRPLMTAGYIFDGTNWVKLIDPVAAVIAGATGVGTTAVEEAGTSFNEITTGATTLVKSGATILHSVCVNTPIASATIKIYNAITAAGTPLTLTIPSTVTGESPFCMKYDVYFSTGITVVTSGATDVTVVYGR